MLKTLLVEDNLNYRDVLKSALLNEFIDLDTREAANEDEALDIVDTYNPDLIFMDIDLDSGTNGLDLTRKIKVEHPGIVVVILSQHDISEYRSIAQKSGADFYFSKSTSLESIFDYVSTVIDNKSSPH